MRMEGGQNCSKFCPRGLYMTSYLDILKVRSVLTIRFSLNLFSLPCFSLEYSVWDVSVSNCFSLGIFSLKIFSLRCFSLKLFQSWNFQSQIFQSETLQSWGFKFSLQLLVARFIKIEVRLFLLPQNWGLLPFFTSKLR